ncbi:MAG TPA: PASTA domain-containing protein [Solirubrobacterales bacterium]|nr:PASTA domain-containing protein [Solirubrobacterales bacterium]
MAEIAADTVFDGRYRILQRIGGGGMADVYLAEDTHLQRQVALKVLHRHFAQDQQFVERFRREAEAAAGLSQPNIVAVYDRGSSEGTYYIAMQYVEGPTFRQLIDRGLTIEQAVAIVRQVLEAARYAHRKGIVHRDLKPQNVIVDPESKAMVADFGIARAGVSDITQTGSVMGTPHYLSPEQAQGQEVTAVSDLYSVGVILYEALTGRVPFEGENAVAIAMKQVSEVPQRPSSINPRVPPALDAVVMRALEKDPGQRFQNADAFIAALTAAMREPGGAGTADFAALPPAYVEPGEEEPEEEEERKRRRRWWLVGLLAAVIVGALIALLLTKDTTTEVPDVTGKQVEFAIGQLERNGFKPGREEKVHRQVAAGTVLEQDPLPGEAEEDCSFVTLFCSKPKVDLTVSIGPGQSVVPGTAGEAQEAATEKLEAAGFEVAVEGQNSSAVDEGLVIHQSPGGGQSATNGSTVTIFVSRGPKLVKVPVLVGSNRRTAVQEIRARGLVPEVGEEETGSAPAGEVLDQSPSAGQRVEPGATVAITVARAEQKAKVPNVIGRERREAVEAIRAAGLAPFVEEEETEVESQIGRVLDQFPTPGSRQPEGAEVTLVVGKRAAVVPEEEEPELEEGLEEGTGP